MKNQIQKPATVHRLKQSGKWAVLVTLVEPRELEGRMRSGRQKFERQTQALANDLCVEINNCLFGKELARQLNPHEIELAKKLFWELLEPKHRDWIENLDKLVGFCEHAEFRLERQKIPTVADAARIYLREHVMNLETETYHNTRRALSFLLPAFGHLKPVEMTDQAIWDLAHGTEPVHYMKTVGHTTFTKEENEAGLWKTLTLSHSQRPWSPAFLRIFLTRVRAFKNWMNASKNPGTQQVRNWCPPCLIETPDLAEMTRLKHQQIAGVNNAVDWECQQKPALTIPQVQALIDVAWVAWGGKFAAFYVHALWCGSRSKEVRRTATTAFDSKDGVLLVPASAAKTDKGRESQLYDNAIVMVEALRQSGLYTKTGLTPNHKQRRIIQILAGFKSANFEANRSANKVRRQLLAQGIELPNYQWGKAYPINALRRTSLSMHYKLFQNVQLTTGWGGNSPDIFQEFYKRLVTKEEASQFWVMLPTWLTRKHPIEIKLPPGHKLDSAMTPNVTSGVSAAGQAMQELHAEMDQAQKISNDKVRELKAAKLAGKMKKPPPNPLRCNTLNCCYTIPLHRRNKFLNTL